MPLPVQACPLCSFPLAFTFVGSAISSGGREIAVPAASHSSLQISKTMSLPFVATPVCRFNAALQTIERPGAPSPRAGCKRSSPIGRSSAPPSWERTLVSVRNAFRYSPPLYPPPQPTGQVRTINREPIHFVESGERPAVILITDWWETPLIGREGVPLLSARREVAIRLAGLGRRPRRNLQSLVLEGLAARIDALLLRPETPERYTARMANTKLPEAVSYGSDKAGLVWGFAFRPGQGAEPIDSDAAARLLEGSLDDQEAPFLWLHFSLGNASSERWIRTHLSLPEAFFDSLTYAVSSTRLEQQDESLLAVVHDVLFEFTFDPSNVSTVYLCVQPKVLVSARPKPLRSIDRLRASARAGVTFRSVASLLAHLLHDQADVLVEIVRDATTRIDAVEDRILQNRVTTTRTELGTLRRTLVRLQRLLAPEPAALFRLLNRPPDWLEEDDINELAAAAEEFSAAVGDSGVLVERIKLLQEELAALVNEQTNRTLFLLTLVTVVALPINLVAGLFGMNVGGIPLADTSRGFALVVSLATVSTAAAGLLVWRIRRR